MCEQKLYKSDQDGAQDVEIDVTRDIGESEDLNIKKKIATQTFQNSSFSEFEEDNRHTSAIETSPTYCSYSMGWRKRILQWTSQHLKLFDLFCFWEISFFFLFNTSPWIQSVYINFDELDEMNTWIHKGALEASSKWPKAINHKDALWLSDCIASHQVTAVCTNLQSRIHLWESNWEGVAEHLFLWRSLHNNETKVKKRKPTNLVIWKGRSCTQQDICTAYHDFDFLAKWIISERLWMFVIVFLAFHLTFLVTSILLHFM